MWRIELDRKWDVLGPFPIHAREQHFLSPAYPLDPSLPIATDTCHPSALARTAHAEWAQTAADPHGVLHVAHPHIPWDQMRATEGWAALQHLNVLRGRLSVYPHDGPEPLLRTELLQGAFFALLPPPDSAERRAHVPEWHCGNVYALERAPEQLVKLPVPPARNGEPTTYEVLICAPYEIRLFGDPSAYSSPHPILTLNFSVSLHSPAQFPLQHVPTHSLVPHIVDGTPFGDAAGVGVQSLDFSQWSEDEPGHWSVIDVRLAHTSEHLSVTLLNDAPVRIQPTQTRVVPLRLHVPPHQRIPEHIKQLEIELVCTLVSTGTRLEDHQTFILPVVLPLTHVPFWTRDEHVPIHASYFFANSTPTIFVVKPPKEALGNSQQHTLDTHRNKPILALHGAGVDILGQPFWFDSLPRQKHAWIVIPQGGTAWGLDWHGPSAADAFTAVSALSSILFTVGSGRWAKWGFDVDTRVILMGHSNGGQGAWYMASRWPDRIVGVVAAAGYIKSQAYVTWSMGHFAHFVDPALRAILDTSLTPDDNDLFLGNLTGKPVLALHGGADDNVPPWQSREQVGILRSWDCDADVMYHEDPGQPHWYPNVLYNDHVQAFLDRVYGSPASETGGFANKAMNFTLTVSIPTESGSLNGWQIHALTTPGLLARLCVKSTSSGDVSVRTTNVAVFSVKPGIWFLAREGVPETRMFAIDGDNISVGLDNTGNTILFVKGTDIAELHTKPHWKLTQRSLLSYPTRLLPTITHCLQTPPQRLQSILSTCATITLLVPSLRYSPELSAALRIAYTLRLFHALDSQIVDISEIEHTSVSVSKGNMVVIGCAESPLVQGWLTRAGGMWSYTDGIWHLDTTRFDRPSSAILFCQPHPYDAQSIALFLQSTDIQGLERAVRLFPIRTGVLSPDWLVVDGRADTIGAAGVQGAGVYGWKAPDIHARISNDKAETGKWVWSERMSWLD